ncbi:Energy-coupling factor transporter ATP-binding protein EcfA (fragment) [groundwater metagenome]|uniref:Energy-coupling factor transporter ATP-binding protein EcfA n=1 Tax=groundwater metagenome TaxID=717931 RepID=A0A098E881_9ZZZZ
MDFQKAIEIKNLSYTYPDGNIALKDINLEIFENECLALIGSNGSGKTTLILNLNGIFRGKGCLKIFNKELSDKNLKEIRKDIGIVFQNPDDQLFMPTVFDDVAFAPLNMSLDEKEVKVRVKNALQAVGMNIYENRFSHHLSSGKRRKFQ